MDNVWLAVVIGILTALGGGTGLSALLRIRQDKKIGIAQQEVSEDDALSRRWAEFVKIQGETLIQPLQSQITELRTEISRQGEEIKTLRSELERRDQELERIRSARWRAIGYIRELLFYIRTHMPEGISPVPMAPADIASDI